MTNNQIYDKKTEKTTTASGKFYRYIDKNWHNSRTFFYGKGKATFFSLAFYFLYAMMQYLKLSAIALIFAIGLERIFMHSHYRDSLQATENLKKYTIELENKYYETDNTLKALLNYAEKKET